MVGNRMKVLVILETNPFVASNAANNRFLSLAEGLSDNGVNVDLLFLNGYTEKNEKVKFKESGTFRKLNYQYLFPYNYSSFVTRNFFKRILPVRFTKRKINKNFKENRYDFIWLGLSSRIVQLGLELFKTQADMLFFHERSEYSWIGFEGNKRIHKLYLEKFLPQIDVLSVMTKTLQNYYKEYVGNKTRIIHLPMTVDLSRFDRSFVENKLDKPYMAYCGEMDNTKDGVDILLQSFIKIMTKFPKVKLYLAGPLFPENDYIMQKDLIRKFSADKRIIYLGSLPKEDIPGFLSNAKVLALARPESKQAEGGFPTKLGEYLATGNPVCVTSVGEIGDYLNDNVSAFFAQPGSVDEFAFALERALTSKNAKEVGIRGKDVAVKNFNKKTQSKLLHNILLKCKNKN